MPIWIDPPRWPAHGRLWSHLISDTSYAELHAFAAANGIPARGFEGDHYDVPAERHAALVAAGARPVDSHELIRRLQRSGLRFPKRKGERPLAAYRNVLLNTAASHTLHVVASTLETPPALTEAAAVFVEDAGGRVLLVHSVVRDRWGAPAGGREPGESVRACAVREVVEESGLTLRGDDLDPCGYERITFDEPPVAHDPAWGRWVGQRSFVAVFRAQLAAVAPAVRPAMPDVDRAEWVRPQEAHRRCREEFWWPLLATVMSWPLLERVAR